MINNKKIVATIEARMTSSRLPGKVLLEANGKPMLEYMIERLRRSTKIDDVVVATTINKEDDPIVELCDRIGCTYYRGSESDVLERVLNAAKAVEADVIVETTGDCPFIDWRHVDYLVNFFMSNNYDFVANNTERTFPIGFDIRIFTTESLDHINSISDNPLDHEHVSIYYPRHPKEYKCYNWYADGPENRPDIEVTLDEYGDYQLIKSIFEGLYTAKKDFTCKDVIDYIDNNPEIKDYVKNVKRTVLDD